MLSGFGARRAGDSVDSLLCSPPGASYTRHDLLNHFKDVHETRGESWVSAFNSQHFDVAEWSAGGGGGQICLNPLSSRSDVWLRRVCEKPLLVKVTFMS